MWQGDGSYWDARVSIFRIASTVLRKDWLLTSSFGSTNFDPSSHRV